MLSNSASLWVTQTAFFSGNEALQLGWSTARCKNRNTTTSNIKSALLFSRKAKKIENKCRWLIFLYL
jgi:hypothetical protein